MSFSAFASPAASARPPRMKKMRLLGANALVSFRHNEVEKRAVTANVTFSLTFVSISVTKGEARSSKGTFRMRS